MAPKHLDQIRRTLMLERKDFCAALGISISNYSRMERGQRPIAPSVQRLALLLYALGAQNAHHLFKGAQLKLEREHSLYFK